jgi:hypothetical protein
MFYALCLLESFIEWKVVSFRRPLPFSTPTTLCLFILFVIELESSEALSPFPPIFLFGWLVIHKMQHVSLGMYQFIYYISHVMDLRCS